MTFDQFLREVCPDLDLEWRKYRRRSARHRVDVRMGELGLAGYGDYLSLVRSSPEEAGELADLMRVTVSRFFRDQRQWLELRDAILPELIATLSGTTLRAWSAGCCGGEEPYSLALLWLDYLAPLHPGLAMEILATDIDDASLERARGACYRRETLRELPAALRERRFSREKGFWRLAEEPRAPVRFENRNLLADPPPLEIDLTLCRYLPFTYYRGERLALAVRRLWESLRPGGILMIGEKESLPSSALELFEPASGSGVFYRRRGG